MRKTLLFLLLPLLVFCHEVVYPSKFDSKVDKGIDSFLVVDPFNPLNKSKIGFNSFLMTQAGLSFLVFSPRMDVYFNGDFDTSIGIGIRRPFKRFVLGNHFFCDYSLQRPLSFYQLGHSFEILSYNFDFRVNYYHPLSTKRFFNGNQFKTERWIESEGIWKFKDFCVGIGPIYNFTNQKWSLKPKVVIPFSFFTVEAGVYLCEKPKEHFSYFSVGIPLYSLGQKPVGRNCSVKTIQKSDVEVDRYFIKKKYLNQKM